MDYFWAFTLERFMEMPDGSRGWLQSRRRLFCFGAWLKLSYLFEHHDQSSINSFVFGEIWRLELNGKEKLGRQQLCDILSFSAQSWTEVVFESWPFECVDVRLQQAWPIGLRALTRSTLLLSFLRETITWPTNSHSSSLACYCSLFATRYLLHTFSSLLVVGLIN